MHIKGTEQFEREINLGKRTNSFPKNVSSFLHCFAGGLLLLYALSHFGFLRITGYNGALPNLVFPFLTNNNLYLTAGLLESSVAVVCVGFRGRANTNFVILSFVALMLLYHWAFYFLGGKHCNCLGTLGVLLHVSKSEEKTLTSLSLVFLTLTTTPWIYSNLRVVLMRIFGKMALALMVILIIPQNAHADGELSRVIEIYGTYKGTSQNPITGEPRIDYQHVEAAFHVTICGDDWIITVTNLIDISDHAINYNVSKFSIGQMWCDGTNTYCLQPAHNHEADYNTNVVTITPSRFYTGSYDPDFLGISLPWLTYCLSPSTIQPDKNGVTALPVPWLQPRFSVFAYGYKWIIAATEDGRFIDNLSTVRDTNLDLSDEDSLLRPGFDYPDSLADYDNIKRRLNAFRYVPSGWVQTKFECTEWYHTNDMSIPAKSEITGFYFNPQIQKPHPSYRGELTISHVVLDKRNKNELFPNVIKPTQVSDFRYRRANSTRIYLGAQYTLQQGESWKLDDDKVLLDQAADYLKHGPRYDAYLHKNNFLVWLLFGVTSLIPIIAVLKSRKKAKNN